MRAVLDRLYRLSEALAAVSMVAICVIVLLQVGGNAIDALAGLIVGRPIGIVVPSYAEFTGFFLVAASSLALASTLKADGHIRVQVALRALPDRWQRRVLAACWLVGAALSGFFAWHAALLVRESLIFGDVSPGMVPVPLWIPQSTMAGGLAVLAIAFVDALASQLMGRAWAEPAAAADDLKES